ncbi:sensor histidine kinase [Psychroserpens sp.]
MRTFFRVLIYLSILLISRLTFGQNPCQCLIQTSAENETQQYERDSLDTFKIIKNLNSSSNIICRYHGLILELQYYSSERELDKVSVLLKDIETVYDSLNCKDELRYSLYSNKSLVYRKQSNLEKLSEFTFLALAEAERLKDDEKQIESIKHIVHLFTRMQESHKNWNYVKRAEILILKQKKSIANVKNYRWLAFEYEHEYTTTERKTLIDSTVLFINKAKKDALFFKMTYEIALLYRALESTSYHKGKPKEGLKYIDSGIYYAKKIKGAKSIGPFYIAKAYDHWDLGQLKEAERWTDTALYYSKNFDNKTDIGGKAGMQVSASEIYEGIGKTKKALASYKVYTELKNSLLKHERIEIVNEIETKYKTDLKDAEINSLSQQQKIDGLELTNKQAKIKQLTIWMILGGSILVLLLFITKMIQLKKTHQKNKTLKMALDRQIQLEKELSDVRDEIAQDFHDDLGNKLARISLLSNLISGEVSINDPKVKSKIKQITEDANGIYTGTRDFVFSLKSNSDYIEEITTYLSDFGEDYFSKTKIKFIVEKSISSNDKLPHYWNKQLVFIFKEALTNTLKHSQCDTVKLKFTYINKQLNITCEDNGIGITSEDLNSSNGLKNMKNRAHKIDGKLHIESTINKGTTVTFIGKVL